MISQTTPIYANYSVVSSLAKVTSMTTCLTGVSSAVPKMRWPAPVPRQRVADAKSFRRMRASHVPVTDSKRLTWLILFTYQRFISIDSVLILARCKRAHLAPWVSNGRLVPGVMAIFGDHLTPCNRAPRGMCGVMLSG